MARPDKRQGAQCPLFNFIGRQAKVRWTERHIIIDPGQKKLVVRVIDVPSCTQGQYLQVYLDGEEQKGVGFLAYPEQAP